MGVETWIDNSKYEGEYHKCKKHGKGTYYYNDGSKYSGEWKDNNISGIVIFIIFY